MDVVVTGASFGDQQRRVLESLATGAPLAETLDLLVRLVEAEVPGMKASILLAEDGRLLHGAAPSLPDAYNDAIHGLAIGDGVGSCGTAAFTGRPVVVEDVFTHPYWEAFRDLARAHGLRACWSTPVLGRSGDVVGTFALYHGDPHVPTPHEQRLVREATHVASLAIQHERLLRTEARRRADEDGRLQLREMMRKVPVAVVLISTPHFTYDFVNSAAERMLERQDLEGKRVIEAFPELEAQGITALLQGVVDSGAPYVDPEFRVKLDRGRGPEDVWFNVRIEPVRDASGAVTAVLSVAVEVTETVLAQQDIERRRGELALSEKTSALGQLVSGVAHEIRTPLTYLATNLNLIQLRLARVARSLPPEHQQTAALLVNEIVPSALEATHRINHIVEDLRAFTQLRHGVREKADLNEVVRQAVSLFQATHRGRVSVRHHPGPTPVVEVDRLQIQQAVLNLLQNALEAEPRDHSVTVRTRTTGAGGAIDVEDKGRGIPMEAQPRVFDPFFTTRTDGTGIGLSIVKRVADDHRGAVSFVTSPEGTTFTLVLPQAPDTKA